ncbi:hypothetical protein [Undibacterium terreum]|uniref:hypothetical protein n=1 Tax=Undibacterium terreum TaxID=1224302 RepID=UPI00166C8FBB|nr:hypothetical protein [Undibacterium terreum]
MALVDAQQLQCDKRTKKAPEFQNKGYRPHGGSAFESSTCLKARQIAQQQYRQSCCLYARMAAAKDNTIHTRIGVLVRWHRNKPRDSFLL